jgi:thymidylate synthase (FAD)
MKKEVLDHGFITLIETWGSDERIIEAARMSTQKGFNGWGVEEACDRCAGDGTEQRSHGRGPGSVCKPCGGSGKRINTPGDEKLLAFLWKNNHATPFEMAGASVEVQAPIFVFREWHRHRTQSYNEMSARYAPLPDVNYVPTVERLMNTTFAVTTNKQAGTTMNSVPLTEANAQEFRSMLERSYLHAEERYQWALKIGVPKELARVHLPVGRYSKMRASANLRNWLGFLTLRQASNAQWEIRQYANALHDMLMEKFPRTLALFDEGKKS